MKKKKIIMGLAMVLCFSLTGCKSSDYKKAVELQEVADYQGALSLYQGIGVDYKDVSDRINECQSFVDAINAYNEAMSVLEDKNAAFDTALSDARTLANGEDKALDETLRPALETAISETKAVRVDIPEMAVTVEEINAQAEKMNTADYTEALSKLQTAYDAMDKSVRQYAFVNNPMESFVIQRLGNVDHVVDISAVTEDNDPNGQLGKAGGYTATVYFSSDWVDQGSVYGTTLIDKGTDAGGAVEVYANEEDAENRNTYLGAFDGGILSSGSHTVIGTCVVRTSDELKASQQKELEAAVIEALTKLE